MKSKFKNILFLSLILLAASALNLSAERYNDSNIASVTAVAQAPNTVITHIVMKGETAYSIAAAYNTTVQSIYKLNPNAEKGIKAGDKLKIEKVRKVTSYSSHLIEPKETLYSVSRMYHISVDDLKNANPGLDEKTFSKGKTIRIPVFTGESTAISATVTNGGYANSNMEYKVQKGETLYSIGKNQGISVEVLLNSNPSLKDGGLKEGMALIIPKRQIQEPSTTANEQKAVWVETPYATKGETVRIGVLLPFLDNYGSIQKEKLVEYYEGFLLAVKEMKNKGLNAEIYTFDIGTEKSTKKLESLLGTNEMKNLHLVVGGVSKQQIEALTKFSKKTGIKYVIPFGSTNDIENTPALFQMTTSHSSLYTEISSAFKDKFRDYNIIFVSEAGSDNDKSDFTNNLKKELSKSNIPFKSTASSDNLITDIRNVLEGTKKNILIPTSSSEITLRKVLAAMNSLTTEAVTLFGYPEWQTYSQHTSGLHKYDSYIYSIFFLDEQQNDVKDFVNEYKKWYNKNLINSYPKYGYLGYDAGLYFLTALNRYGSSFENSISNLKITTLQSAAHFERINDRGGFINNGLYLIQYKTGSGIEKTDISR
jgi:LysM repeat protein